MPDRAPKAGLSAPPRPAPPRPQAHPRASRTTPSPCCESARARSSIRPSGQGFRRPGFLSIARPDPGRSPRARRRPGSRPGSRPPGSVGVPKARPSARPPLPFPPGRGGGMGPSRCFPLGGLEGAGPRSRPVSAAGRRSGFRPAQPAGVGRRPTAVRAACEAGRSAPRAPGSRQPPQSRRRPVMPRRQAVSAASRPWRRRRS